MCGYLVKMQDTNAKSISLNPVTKCGTKLDRDNRVRAVYSNTIWIVSGNNTQMIANISCNYPASYRMMENASEM